MPDPTWRLKKPHSWFIPEKCYTEAQIRDALQTGAIGLDWSASPDGFYEIPVHVLLNNLDAQRAQQESTTTNGNGTGSHEARPPTNSSGNAPVLADPPPMAPAINSEQMAPQRTPEAHAGQQPPERGQKHSIAASIATLALLSLLAATLNPSQEQHLKDIEAIAKRKDYPLDDVKIYALNKGCSYNNYFLFSTTTFGGNRMISQKYLMSYGLFGFVKTTASVDPAVADLTKFLQELQQKK